MRENRRRYGSRRIAKALGKSGIGIGRGKARRLMKEEGLKAIQSNALKPKTTNSKGVAPAPNLLTEFKLGECAPAKIIIGDITYIRVRGGIVLLFGSVTGQGDAAAQRLESGSGDDCRFGHFRLGKSCS
jgi:transposase InsO family protein